tara:strand:- start:6227 stop:6814 length:588 start_codon:yes stop_codon:yes gene_type:complete
MQESTIEAIHEFWFGELDANGFTRKDRSSLWFKADRAVDAECRLRFGDTLASARAGELTHWRDSDRGLVALVVLLDQFSRNIHRGTPQAFAADDRALSLSRACIDSARDSRLPVIHRVFMYLPLEHCEDLHTQRECVRLFSALADAEPGAADFLRYAVAHCDVIEQFGRFPHRNAILGRTSTAEELEYLETHGGF